LNQSSRARYAQLAENLLQKIANGTYPVGSLLPTEFDLGRQYGVSRTTVREAIRHLTDLGLILRKPGVGTLVRAQHADPRFVHAIKSISDIFQYVRISAKPTMHYSAEIEAGKDETELLQCSVGQRWLKFELVRLMADSSVPLVLTEAFIKPAYERVMKLAPTSSGPLYTIFGSEYNELIVEVWQDFCALEINLRQADLLKVKVGSAGLYVTRHYFGRGDQLLLVTRSLYPADRFSYTVRYRYSRQPNPERSETDSASD
jgi:GntR family transcriptional regulator